MGLGRTAKTRPMRAILLIDAENLPHYACAAEAYMQRKYPNTKSYAFGSTAMVKALLGRLHAMGVETYTTATGHNSADKALKAKLVALLREDIKPDLIAIASCDGDFAPIARDLKKFEIRTLCIASSREKASKSLKKSFDDIVYIEHEKK
jgi:hypothetical protein